MEEATNDTALSGQRSLPELCYQASKGIHVGRSHDQWAARLLAGYEAAEIALLLCLLPNTAEMHLSFSQSFETAIDNTDYVTLNLPFDLFIATVDHLQERNDGRHRFQSLKRLYVASYSITQRGCHDTPSTIPPIAMFCRLPSLDLLYLEGSFDASKGWADVRKDVHLRHLELNTHISSLTASTLERLIHTYSGLRSLHILQCGTVSGQEIIKTIGTLHECLEELTLGPWSYSLPSNWSLQEDVHPLTRFTKLRKLNIPQGVILDWACPGGQFRSGVPYPGRYPLDALPSSLEILRIYRCEGLMLRYIDRYLHLIRERLPNLLSIDYESLSLEQRLTNLQKVADDILGQSW